ncbi:tetraspanin-18-like isoform X2 [Dunckerocampus dactyliophorus]|uniref:tetraspanin-18-like isoform X2 n=1 Tax=Dunckerocampus dactyliophorus TaxID=161453 RepID=UPI0024067396|nr:tetraspanin-18-like isoform X2 [Dunckerocampus dactyliophorus]
MFQHRISCCMLLFSLERLLENLENCSRLVSLTSTCVVFVSQGQGEASARLTTSIMGDCVNCIRRLLIICSAIIALIGAFMIAVSVWILMENDPIGQVLMGNSMVSTSVNCVMVLSVLVFLVGILGCFGAIREKQFTLSLFFMAVSLIYVLQLLGLILVFVNRVTLQKESLTEQLRLAYVPSNKNALQLSPGQTNDQSLPETSKDHWKKVMAEFGCCGVNGMEDFKNETYRDDCCNTLENPSPALTSCEAFDLADPETHKGFMLVLSAMFLAVMLYREI